MNTQRVEAGNILLDAANDNNEIYPRESCYDSAY